jgi:hypothetical protein
MSEEVCPFPEGREPYDDYRSLRDVFYPEYFDIHSRSSTDARDYWDEIRGLYTDDMGYSPEAFSQLSDMAFRDPSDLELLGRENLRYIEVQRRLFSATREVRE